MTNRTMNTSVARLCLMGATVLGTLVATQACSSDPSLAGEAPDDASAASDTAAAKDAGVDSSRTCDAPATLCAGACVSTSTDLQNCGACGKACAAGDVCSNGNCGLACGAGTTECNRSLLDAGADSGGDGGDAGSPRYCAALSADPANCGACGKVCSGANVSASTCVAGSCGVKTCAAGFGDCDGNPANGCEVNTNTSSANCGTCGTLCANAKTCSNGLCCAAPLTGCGGGCVDTQADANNCGGCGVVCGGTNPFCGAGTCQTFASSAAPVAIPMSSACSLLLDTNAHQIDVSPGGIAYVLLRCGAGLSVSKSSNGGKTFSAPVAVAGFGLPQGAQIYARNDGKLYVLGGFTASNDAQLTRSTDGGATWSATAVVGPNFGNSGPGPSVTLAHKGTALFASWSNPTSSSPAFTSTDDGATWTALPSAPAAGTNYCPDVFFNAAGDLVLANEVNRTVYKLPNGAAAWTLVGNINPATVYSDFAAGGLYLFATGSSSTVQRAPIDAFVAADIVSATLASSSIYRSMSADSAGNLAFAIQQDSTHVRVHRWAVASTMFDVGIDVASAGTNPIPATAAFPNKKGSVTAVSSQGAAAIEVWSEAY